MGFIHRNTAKKTKHAGYSFASKLEANTFDLLKLRERAGEIRGIQVQDTIKLSAAGIIYKPDFHYYNVMEGCDEWAEAKGLETAEWRIKRKLWQFYGPGPLLIYMAPSRWSTVPVLKETIIPKGVAA